MDWSDCPLVKTDSRYHDGAPVLRDMPRMTVDGLVESLLDYGETLDSIREQFAVPVETTAALVRYARARRRAPHPV